MTIADWMSHVSALIAASPVSTAGTVVACGCAAVYAVTRVPEFLLVASTASVYAVVAALLVVQG